MRIQQGYVKIRDIVFEMLAEERRPTTHYFIPYLVYALQGYREFRNHWATEVVTKDITVEKNGEARLPDDYVKFNKIGLRFGDRVEIMYPDPTLARKMDNKYLKPDSYQGIRVPFFNYWSNATGLPEDLYGYFPNQKSVDAGYYKIDESCRRIIVDTSYTSKTVYLEYIGTGYHAHSHTIVHHSGANVIKAYASWKTEYHKNKASSATRAAYEEYQNEIRLMKQSRSDVTHEGLVYINRKNTHLGPK